MAKDIEEKIGAMSQKNCHGLKYKYPLKNYRVHEMPTGDQLPPHYPLFTNPGSATATSIITKGKAKAMAIPLLIYYSTPQCTTLASCNEGQSQTMALAILACKFAWVHELQFMNCIWFAVQCRLQRVQCSVKIWGIHYSAKCHLCSF